ncbi:hypothetical protein [Sorangium sp. So ce204]|uniref:hypothetical protein n=1 Tax=Sorangium sp. So ce204 TaxID=3133288 RepID=UPI003F5E63D0
MVVNPTVGTGLGSLYVRNVTDGQKDFTRVVFDNINTTGVTARVLVVPLLMGVNKNPSNFNGFIVAAYGDSNAGVVESLLEVPLLLNATTRNPSRWNGWEIGGINSGVQVDNLRSALNPYLDFVGRNQYIAD